MVAKVGYKPFMVAGPAVLAIGLFILSSILKVGGNYWHNVFPGLAVCALGMGFTFVAASLAATSGVPKHLSGLASGVLNTSQQIGGAIGLAILAAVAFSTVKTDMIAHHSPAASQVHGYRSALHVGIGLAILAVIVVVFVVKNHKVDPHEMQMG
jgi:MFS family permease